MDFGDGGENHLPPEVKIDFIERQEGASLQSIDISNDLEEIKAEGNIILGINKICENGVPRRHESGQKLWDVSPKNYTTPSNHNTTSGCSMLIIPPASEKIVTTEQSRDQPSPRSENALATKPTLKLHFFEPTTKIVET